MLLHVEVSKSQTLVLIMLVMHLRNDFFAVK